MLRIYIDLNIIQHNRAFFTAFFTVSTMVSPPSVINIVAMCVICYSKLIMVHYKDTSENKKQTRLVASSNN